MTTVSHYLQSKYPSLPFKCEHSNNVSKCAICFENNILDSLLLELKISESQTKKRVCFLDSDSNDHATSSRKIVQ